MKKYLNILIILLITLFSYNSLAYSAPEPPANGTYVLDLSNKLSIDQISSLNQKIDQIKSNSTNEFAVLILESLEGNSIEDVAYTVFNSWGIGKKNIDNGVLIVISTSDRKTRIETGKGAGELTDLQCNDILSHTLRPFLRNNDYFGGLNASIDAANNIIDNKSVKKSNAQQTNSADSELMIFICVFVGLIVFGVIFLLIFISAKDKRKRREIEEAYKIYSDREREMSQYLIQRRKTMPSIHETALEAVAIAAGASAVTAVSVATEKHSRKHKDSSHDSPKSSSYDSDSSSSSSYSSSSSWPSSDSGSFGGFDGGGSSGGGGSSSDF